jgi:hypothetical protein
MPAWLDPRNPFDGSSGLERYKMSAAAVIETGRLIAPTRPPSRAISVGTPPMIAIPVAAFMRPVAVIVGRSTQTRCNDSGHGSPMIAIRGADDCNPLQVSVAGFRRNHRLGSVGIRIHRCRTLDRRAHHQLAESLPQAGEGLGVPEPVSSAVPSALDQLQRLAAVSQGSSPP